MERSLRGLRLGIFALVVACSSTEEAAPVRVAKDFVRALRVGDTERLLPLLEPSVLEELEAASQRASDQVGGRRKVSVGEMLQVVGVERRAAIIGAEMISADEERATVELSSSDGKTHRVELLFLDGGWRVQIPRPQRGGSSSQNGGAPVRTGEGGR